MTSLDVTSTQEELGKPVLSDEKNQKTTYVTLEGLEEGKTGCQRISDRAVGRLAGLPGKNEFLYDIIEMLVNRKTKEEKYEGGVVWKHAA